MEQRDGADAVGPGDQPTGIGALGTGGAVSIRLLRRGRGRWRHPNKRSHLRGRRGRFCSTWNTATPRRLLPTRHIHLGQPPIPRSKPARHRALSRPVVLPHCFRVIPGTTAKVPGNQFLPPNPWGMSGPAVRDVGPPLRVATHERSPRALGAARWAIDRCPTDSCRPTGPQTARRTRATPCSDRRRPDQRIA